MEIVAFHPYSGFSNAVFVERVTNSDWSGVVLYISVERDAITKKLDDYYNSVSNGCGDGPRLFVPEDPVLQEIHNSDRHPVYIDFGFMRTHDFDDYLENNPDPCVSTSGLEVAVTIPLLADKLEGQPVYALALTKFYEKSRGDIPKLNVLYPYRPVDEISLSEDGAFVRNKSDELRVYFHRAGHLCKRPAGIVKEEFDEFVFSDFQFGLPAPDYSFCDRHSFESQFCSNAERVKCGVQRYSPNICLMWETNDVESCETRVEIMNITAGFREFILLGNDPVSILASESFHCNTTNSLKYPCQEFN